jgi:hypothetical protein
VGGVVEAKRDFLESRDELSLNYIGKRYLGPTIVPEPSLEVYVISDFGSIAGDEAETGLLCKVPSIT